MDVKDELNYNFPVFALSLWMFFFLHRKATRGQVLVVTFYIQEAHTKSLHLFCLQGGDLFLSWVSMGFFKY